MNTLTLLDLYSSSPQHRAHENVDFQCVCDRCNNEVPERYDQTLADRIRTQTMRFGGPGSGCNPEAGKCGRPPGPGHPEDHSPYDVGKAVDKKFGRYEKMVKAIDNKKINGLAVFGAPGIGKSKTVIDALEKSTNNLVKIRGQITPKELFNTLSQNRNEDDIVWFDDADAAFKDSTARNILKAALDSDEPREISWLTSKKDDDVEQTFRFKGRIIVTTNIKLSENDDVKAVTDRMHWIDLDLTNAEKMHRIEQVAPKLLSNLDTKTQKEIVGWMKQNQDKLGDSLSLRTAKKIGEVASFDDDWRETAESYAKMGQQSAKPARMANIAPGDVHSPSQEKSAVKKVGRLDRYGRAANEKGFTMTGPGTFKHEKGTLTRTGGREWTFKPTTGKATSGKGYNNFTKFLKTLK